MPNPADGPTRYPDFASFYQHYLGEHAKASTRVTHLIGTLGLLAIVVLGVVFTTWWLIPIGIVIAYGAAWAGHILCERNRPATFRQPFYSIAADFRMCFEILTGTRPLRES